VSDTGPGVPQELDDQIFVDGFSTKPAEGKRRRGLGLALVHRLVRRAGGTIAITRSDETVFTVVLPVIKPAKARA
jgi:two-component system CitB family sensor kinase